MVTIVNIESIKTPEWRNGAGNKRPEYIKVLKEREGAWQEKPLLCKHKDWSLYPKNRKKNWVKVRFHLESQQAESRDRGLPRASCLVKTVSSGFLKTPCLYIM